MKDVTQERVSHLRILFRAIYSWNNSYNISGKLLSYAEKRKRIQHRLKELNCSLYTLLQHTSSYLTNCCCRRLTDLLVGNAVAASSFLFLLLLLLLLVRSRNLSKLIIFFSPLSAPVLYSSVARRAYNFPSLPS